MSVNLGPKIPIFVSALQGDGYTNPGNALLRSFQALIQPNVIAIQNTPPGFPSNGDMYVVATGGVGTWTGQDNNIAYWSTDNASAPTGEWEYYTPIKGWVVGNHVDGSL